MFRFLAIALLAVLAASPRAAWAREEARTIVVLHDGGDEASPLVYAAPVLKYLGLLVEPHSAADPLPDLAGRADVRGVLIWLDTGAVADRAGFTAWVRGATQQGLPVALMGATPDADDRFGLFLALDLLYAHDERAYTYDLRAVEKDTALIEAERRFDNLFPPVDIVRPLQDAAVQPLLVLQRRSDVTDRTMPLIVTPKGAYAAAGYALWVSPDGKTQRWMVDPVAWFRLAFHLDAVPTPDLTTLNARRILSLALAPSGPDDGPAAIAAGEHLMAGHPERSLDVLLDGPGNRGPVAPPRPCADRARAHLMGYSHLLAQLDAGEAPRRIAGYTPVLLVCEAESDLTAGAANAVLGHARTLPLATSKISPEALDIDFGAIRLDRIDTGVWRVLDRGALNTLRFDDADHLRIDWSRTEGVLGAGRVHGALYISLDPDAGEPVVALTNMPWEPPPFATLVESRWMISGLVRDVETAAMNVQGSGPGDMVWSVEPFSEWELTFKPKTGAPARYRAVAGFDGVLSFSLPASAGDGGTLTFERHDLAEVGP
ncbi:hypothetical protein sos41_30560 [Alphaproteobacteria bacterium SO-S41]|nr:hypothetical protein sos41_30560 [Alphaproteobacteria bacterium SO-S41]